jgi:pyridoxamine 5'-phosphate oxidase
MALDAILDEVWTHWTRAAANRKSPFHTPCIATVDPDGTPQARIMVLRAADRARGTLRFHTDLRSAKSTQAGAASVLGYDAEARVQVRLTGTAQLESGPSADAAWLLSSLSSRRCYLAEPGPGTEIEHAASGLPANFETRVPSAIESEAGRPHFAILLFTVRRIDWLHLAATGHRRARFESIDGDWQGQWLIP